MEMRLVDYAVKHDCTDVGWSTVSLILKSADMVHHDPEDHRRAFEGSHTTVFINF